jgi:3-phosphoshikimate 1-carboxyvinyltransferase
MNLRLLTPPSAPIRAAVTPPGSKSHTIRALFMAACAAGRSEIVGPLDSEDTAHARACLERLGVQIDDRGEHWDVSGVGGTFGAPDGPLDAGESGLTARFSIATAGLVNGRVIVEGRGRLPQRPMSELIAALRKLGYAVSDDHPWEVEGAGRVVGGEVEVDASTSSQTISALLLVAPMMERGLWVRPIGEVASPRYIDLTSGLMRVFGADPHKRTTGWQVGGGGYVPATVKVPIDASAMVYPAAAAAISGGEVEIHGDPGDHPDLRFLDAIEMMGCKVDRSRHVTVVHGPDRLTGLDVNMGDAPDSAVALAVLCAVARGRSRIDGLGSLRVKESDRLAALEAELTKVGATVAISGDSLIVDPVREPRAAILSSHGDHRMAMSLSLLGLIGKGISIDGAGAVAKTWPGFWDWYSSLGGNAEGFTPTQKTSE